MIKWIESDFEIAGIVASHAIDEAKGNEMLMGL
jgi:hypothetical protein